MIESTVKLGDTRTTVYSSPELKVFISKDEKTRVVVLFLEKGLGVVLESNSADVNERVGIYKEFNRAIFRRMEPEEVVTLHNTAIPFVAQPAPTNV